MFPQVFGAEAKAPIEIVSSARTTSVVCPPEAVVPSSVCTLVENQPLSPLSVSGSSSPSTEEQVCT